MRKDCRRGYNNKSDNILDPGNTAAGSNGYPCLDRVAFPDDLKKLDKNDMKVLCGEIREFLIENVSVTGGHLASNLGVVELTVALLRVFDFPRDHIIFDVGHQSYVYKMLTGRKKLFPTLRQSGGLGGFPRRDESEYDCFGTGHSSTSLSAALGFAEAEKLNGSEAYTVAVVGDGAFTGGMIHEALNNCDKDLKLIIILNENEMSISKNIGRFAMNLSKMRSKTGYFKAKKTTRDVLTHIPLIGKPLFRLMRDTKKMLKNSLYGSNYFENMGLYYLGPVDGNNEEDVEALLREAKKLGESVVIHVKTQKGRGLAEAENSPGKYHSIPPISATPTGTSGLTFSEMLGLYLKTKAADNKKIVAITAAMSYGTGLEPFKEAYPDRFFDVGIAEEHAVTFAAGLAAAGYRPVVPIYSTFLQRSYDNIVHDVALQKLPVVICSDRAGLNAHDGATHHGIFDVAFLSEIPGIRIYTPITFKGLEKSLDRALSGNFPAVIRYPHAGEDPTILSAFYPEQNEYNDIGLRIYGDVCGFGAPEKIYFIITHGRISAEAVRAADFLNSEKIPTAVLLAEFIKPYEALEALIEKRLHDLCEKHRVGGIIFVEEEIKNGGFGMIMSERLSHNKTFADIRTDILAPDDTFVIPAKGKSVYDAAGVSAECIAAKIRILKAEND